MHLFSLHCSFFVSNILLKINYIQNICFNAWCIVLFFVNAHIIIIIQLKAKSNEAWKLKHYFQNFNFALGLFFLFKNWEIPQNYFFVVIFQLLILSNCNLTALLMLLSSNSPLVFTCLLMVSSVYTHVGTILWFLWLICWFEWYACVSMCSLFFSRHQPYAQLRRVRTQ